MPKGNRNKTSPKRIAMADTTARVLDLRRAGLSVREIAAETGIPRSTVQDHLDRGLADIPKQAREALVAEVHDRQLGIIAALWPSRSDPDCAKVIQAADRVLMDLYGLKAAVKIEDVTPPNTAREDVLSKLARIAAASSAGGDPPPTNG